MQDMYFKNKAEVRKYKIKGIVKDIFLYLFLTFFALFTLIPFYWMISTALKTSDELIQIPQKGFEKLNIQVSPEILSRMTLESSNSPQLMQYICFNINTAAKRQMIDAVTDELLTRSCQITTINLD